MQEPEFEIDELVNVVVDEESIPAIVLGVQYMVPMWYYVVALERPIRADFGLQKGLFLPETSLSATEDKKTNEPELVKDEGICVGSYVYTSTEDQVQEGEPAAVDVRVLIVRDTEGKYYVQTVDAIDGESLWNGLPYNAPSDAEEVARKIIEENHEAGPGEDAAAYLSRIAKEESESH